jgi:phosphorylcholine metabolism protein LicD
MMVVSMADRTFRLKKNRDDAIKVLKIVVEVLDNYGIDYYLDFGTLIGAIRDNGLIPWDDDIDISLMNQDDYKKIPDVLKEISKKNLRTYLFTFDSSFRKRKKRKKVIHCKEKVSFTNSQNYQIAKVRTNKFLLFGRGNTCIDIFFKYEYNDSSYWLAYGKENSVPLTYMCNELVDIDFCGIKCKIPKEYDKYLTYKYGNWKVPNDKWNHENDDYSIH